MTWKVALVALATATAAARAQGRGPIPGEVPYRVVVHVANPVSRLTRDEVSRLFLKRTTRWPAGHPVLPVDQWRDSPVRGSFTREVHRRTVASVQSYWQQQVFLRRGTPPPEKQSDQEVLAFVRANPNAIGYVHADANLGDSIKVLIVIPS